MKITNLAALVVCVSVLFACKQEASQGEVQSFQAITVTTSTVEISESYSASIQGRQDIEIFPEVSGKITSVKVTEGQRVKKGEVLFVIDQVPYQASLRTATANVHAAEAQVETSRLDYESKKVLFDEDVISEYDLSTAKNALAVSEAGLEQARAQEIDARNNLSYTEVKSPSDGVVGTLPYRVGTLVSSSMSQPLTTVSDNAQMYVYFSMTENQLRELMRRYGSPEEVIRRMPSVQLELNDGSIYEEKGRIETISGVINSQTGTVSIRSTFPNAQRTLITGGIGNVIIPHVRENAIVIPQTATSELQDKLFVYKAEDGKAVQTFITVQKLNDGNEYVVLSGLKAGDVIVSEGVGLLRDGMEIAVKQ